MQRQFVASAFVISEDRTLLIYHRKLKKWLNPGGHVDPNELPSEAAIREVFEETGLEVELLSEEHLWIDNQNATSFPRPFLCVVEDAPAFGDQPAHEHIDFVYISRPIKGQETLNNAETDGLRWFTLEEVDALTNDVEIFAETKDCIHSIFNLLHKNSPGCTVQLKNSLTTCQK